MWMGSYGSYTPLNQRRIYLESFLAGTDMLMIPGDKYRSSRKYFKSTFDQSIGSEQKPCGKSALTAIGAPSTDSSSSAYKPV